MKKRGLGANLDVFLSRTKRPEIKQEIKEAVTEIAAASASAPRESELCKLPVELLQRGRYQPRKEFAQEKLQELAGSIRTQGIIQPVVVRSVEQNRYEIIAGERRWRAAQLAGLTEIPAILKNMSDETALAVALIENIQRENLNPLEEAVALQRLIDEFDMTHQEVAESVGKSRTTVTNLLRLLTLPEKVKISLEQGQLEMGHARALLSLDVAEQIEVAKTVAEKKLSVRETEKLVSSWQKTTPTAKGNTTKKLDPNIYSLQKQLSDKLGAAVLFQQNNKGKGKMVIHYNSLDELEGILERIN